MNSSAVQKTPEAAARRRLVTTRWSMVLHARGDASSPDAHVALSELCEAYWLPLYAFIRRQTPDVHAAQDLTQAFFTLLLEKHYLDDVHPNRGRFRAFLLAAVKHFLSNERDKARALKRGGGVHILSLDWQQGERRLQNEPEDGITAERMFDREWALALLDRVLERLKSEQHAAGKAQSFAALQRLLSTERTDINYAAAAETLGMTEEATRVAVHRLRKRYRFLLRDEIAQTIDADDSVEDELKALFAVLT